MKDEIKDALTVLSLHAGKMTPGQLEFVKGVNHYYSRYKVLSDKQKNVLFSIKNSLSEISFTSQKSA